MEIEKKDEERFWKKVDKKENEECWEWRAGKRAGYGAFKMNGKVQSSHRVVYSMEKGEIPGEKLVLHKCDNRKCVNPSHLYLGDYSRNIQDRLERTEWKPGDSLPKGENHPNTKLTEEEVIEIREKYSNKNITQKELAKDYPVARKQITKIVNERCWKNI